MKKVLITLLLTAFCFVNAYSDGDDDIIGVPGIPPTQPGPGMAPPSAATARSLKSTATQITYNNGFIRVYTPAYQNKIVRVQSIKGVVLYEAVMTADTLTIDARNWTPNTYDVVILTK